MNMLLNRVENPDVSYPDSLSEDWSPEGSKFTLILANPPFSGSLDYESTSVKLQRVVKTKKPSCSSWRCSCSCSGPAAVIVPDGVLFQGSLEVKQNS